jgi:hypothetical protein
MTTSTNLALPYLAPAQAQKHVTVNEALRRLDALVQLGVVSAATTAQPASPADGAVYVLPPGKTGAAWGAMANHALAYWRDGAWEQITPREGWLAWAQDANQLLAFDGAAWSQAAVRAGLGLGAAALVNTGSTGAVVPLLNAPFTLNGFITIAGAVAGFQLNDRNGGTNYQFYVSGSQLRVYSSTGVDILMANNTAFQPASDNTMFLGSGSLRWSQLFAATGAINTSDAREKTALAPLSEALKRAAARIKAGIGVFQWLEAIARKGADGARLHVGVTAQAVFAAFEAEGLDPWRYGLFCADPLAEEVETAPARVDPETGVLIAPQREARPVLDPETGLPMLRLGVRTDQLALLLAAAG